MPIHPLRSHQRQVHLDFHPSPYTHDVGVEFQPDEFALSPRDDRRRWSRPIIFLQRPRAGA